MAKSAARCIETNDFNEAKARFDNAYRNWKEHWFNACYEIAKNNQEIFQKYVFDCTEITITDVVFAKLVTRKNGGAFVYLIKMFDENNNYVYLKGGKANNLSKRYYDLKKTHYKREDVKISRIEEIKVWCLPSSHSAETFEQALHSYFSRTLTNIPNDRWTPIEPTKEDFEALEQRYETIKGWG